ncbi:MAG: hypothetical protein KatS3mg131_1935 [Candidatus Tectimicrobiota bacterium]|nr:MAG: hypothetical protein KatS3mg131_1935 [Candidatus Tectomicrobia bacterium]
MVVDLYPFAEAAARGDLPLEALLEHIDIGGPALLRAAAKNFPDVAVLCSPQQYGALLAELEAHGGATRYAFRRQLAREAFRCTALYDALIGHVLAENGEAPLPPQEVLPLLAGRPLRYGENPHQRAILYQTLEAGPSLLRARQLHGKALSFNNLADADAALAAVCEFAEPAVVIVKHQTPCGVALGTTPAEAYERAYATDPDAASGGRHLHQPPRRLGPGRSHRQPLLRPASGPGFCAGGARGAQAAQEPHPAGP